MLYKLIAYIESLGDAAVVGLLYRPSVGVVVIAVIVWCLAR